MPKPPISSIRLNGRVTSSDPNQVGTFVGVVAGAIRHERRVSQEECWKDCLNRERSEVISCALELPEQCWRRYWLSLYGVARRAACSPEESEDLVQGFLLELFEREYISRFDPARSAFGTFLRMAFKRFIMRSWRARRALKRDQARSALVIDRSPTIACHQIGIVDQMTPERAYERICLFRLISKASVELLDAASTDQNRQLVSRLIPLAVQVSNSLSYGALAHEFQHSEASLKMIVCRLRKRFISVLRREIAKNCRTEDEFRAELLHLLDIVAD